MSAETPAKAALRIVRDVHEDLDVILAKPRAGALSPGVLEAEQTVIGALLVGGAEALRRAGDLRREHFGDERHGLIHNAIRDEADDSGVVDVATISDRLVRNGHLDQVGGVAYLIALAETTPGATNVARYAAMVREHAARRRLEAVGQDIAARAVRGDPAELRREARARLDALETRDDRLPEPLDLAALADREPVRPLHLIPCWLPAGEVAIFGGHGATNKSGLALDTAVRVSCGIPWLDGTPTERRPVLYVSAEDPAYVLHWRLSRITTHLGVRLADLAGHLEILDMSAIDAELMIDPGRGEEPILTAFYEALRERVKPSTVLVLDGASDLYGAGENVRRHVRRFVRALRRLVGRDGAVLLIVHVDKAAARDASATDRYSGSTAWHNSARARWSLAAEADGGSLVLTLAKANHAKAGAKIRLRWDEKALLYLAEPTATEGGVIGSIRDRAERDDILAALRACAEAGITIPAATQGPRTALHVLRAQPAFPETLRADTRAVRRRFWRAVEDLRALHAIEDREIRASHGHTVSVLAVAKGAS